MSNSYRKTPITGWTTAKTEKWFKKICNGRRRVVEREALSRLSDEIHDPARGLWGPKDGKTWFGEDRPELLRK